MSETYAEVLQGQFEQRRKDYLRDMDISELMDLFPEPLDIKEILLDEIINQNYDKDILPEDL